MAAATADPIVRDARLFQSVEGGVEAGVTHGRDPAAGERETGVRPA
jgi:hypothetical protein